MTELKAKASRAPHVVGGAPSPSQAGSALLGRPDAGPFPAAGQTPAAAAAPGCLGGLPFPRLCRGPDPDPDPDGKALSHAEGAYPRVGATGGAGRAPEKDSGLLDSVLDTLLAPSPSGPGQSHASPPAYEAGGLWCLFGPELPEGPPAVPAAPTGALPALMSRPESKAGGDGAYRALPTGLSPNRQLLLPSASSSGHQPWPGAPGKPAALEVEVEEGGSGSPGAVAALLKGKPRAEGGGAAAAAAGASAPGAAEGGGALVPKEDPRYPAAPPRVALAEQEPPPLPAGPGRPPVTTMVMDFIHVPILPINPALLAARTRQLLEGTDGSDGGGVSAFAPPRGSPSASSPPGAAGDFPDCAYPPEPELYGDFQPPALKIKEEEEGAEAAARSPRPYLGAGAGPAVFPDFPLAPPPLPPPPRAPSSRPGEAAGASASSSASASPSGSGSGSALECMLYKAEAAPPLPGPFAPQPCKPPAAAAAGAGPALYPPLAINGIPPLGYPAAVLKEGLAPVYPPYLNYLRPDAEASQSPQYSFESLPQKICLICGDEASGCHYGVLTCGSCKVFFKRAMEGQHNYLCAGRNDCIVDKIRRKNCPACRLRKCCQAGMVLGGRKFKKFNKVRVMRALDAVALPQTVAIPNESQALSQRISFSPSQDLQLVPSLINVLLNIEPDMVYAGHDNSKPDTSSALLTSLNQLGERQLLSVVKWSKALPGFRNLHIDDQITLIQYSWMSLMVFALGWRSYKHVSGKMLYFAPDLIINEQRMKELSFYSLCLTMWQIPQEFVKLQISQEEFLCMKVLLLLNTIPLEGLRSQNQFEEMRASYIRELIKAIGLRQKGVVSSSQRFYHLTKFLDNLHDLVKQLHLYCLNTFIQSRALSVEFPEMMSEVIAAQLPKILAGMVKHLLFHKK
ncbi:unnamed protein product [Pipistrellus nathusii]|uniref:Progesterone receptor n=1 Tax=Pipistrellus nathusii TaxID=59473 RepID=A0ABP0AEB7_PIPNA